MSININSETSCRNAYLNYHCQGNSMGITAAEMGEITQAWKGRLASWQSTVSNDDNRYEFDDSEFEHFKTSGKKQTKDEVGHNGNTAGAKVRGSADCIASGLAATGSTLAACGIGNVGGAAAGGAAAGGAAAGGAAAGGAAAGGAAAGEVATDVASETATNTAGKAGNAFLLISCALNLATGILYQALKPNKEEKRVCDELQNVMQDSQNALNESQDAMDSYRDEIDVLSDEAYKTNEDANDEIKDKKTDYDQDMATYEALKSKAEYDKHLTKEEQALYKEVCISLKETSTAITTLQDETTDAVDDIHSNIQTYEEGYDNEAETMAEVQGTTDFAAGLDETTKTMCIVEGAAQSLNAASGLINSVRAGAIAAASTLCIPKAILYWAATAAAGVGAGLSGAGATEQFKWAGDVGNEIHMRRDTESLNNDTMESYDNELDLYETTTTSVEELGLEIPDKIEAPKDTDIPNMNTPYPNNTPESLKPDSSKAKDPNKKPDKDV